MLASFAIFQFLWVWNDLLVALVFLGPGDKAPMTVSISQLLGQQGQGQELVTAAGMFSMILPIVVFLVTAAVLRPRPDGRGRQGLSHAITGGRDP